jgi:hypothetical protein
MASVYTAANAGGVKSLGIIGNGIGMKIERMKKDEASL